MRLTHKLWIFPAILCLFCVLTFLEGFSLIGLILLILWLVRIYYLKNRPILIISVVLTCFFLITVFHTRADNNSLFNEEKDTFIVYPKVTSIKVDGAQLRFNGLIENEKGHEEVVVTYRFENEKEQLKWQIAPPQTYLAVNGQLEKPSSQRNFYQFNYEDYLRRESIFWVLKADTLQVSNVSKSNESFLDYIEQIRHKLFGYIDRTFTAKIATYLKTLLFADKRQFSENMLRNYRALGVVHLFSISGFHISYLIKLLKQFLLRLGITHEHANVILLLILPLYGLIAGMGVSVFRAVSQNMLVLFSKIFNRQLDTLDAWALTLILALFVNPYQIYGISFQLSYSLSGMFILLGKHEWIQALHPFYYSMLFSLMSGLVSLPILTYHFFEFSWITLLANLLFIPLFSNLFFPFLMFLFALSFLFKATRFFKLMEQLLLLLIQLLESVTTLFSDLFDFSFVTGRLPFLVFILMLFSIFFVLQKLEKREIPKIKYLLLILFCLFFNQYSPVGRITMLDVGQGDAILLKAPYGRGVTLIDTGGRVEWGQKEEWMQSETPFTIGEDIIAPALKAYGIKNIDRLYITHADTDHSGEILNIAKAIPIKEIAATENTLKDDLLRNQILNMEATRLKLLVPTERLDLPNEQTLAIYPKQSQSKQSKNDQSLVLYGTMGGDKWLFTGDIEKDGEEQLLKDYPNLKTDYLKVSHHGSQTSTSKAFIEKVQPKTALISAGKDNSFGHPHGDVLTTLKEEQVTTYITSEAGAISIRYLYLPFLNRWLSDIRTVNELN